VGALIRSEDDSSVPSRRVSRVVNLVRVSSALGSKRARYVLIHAFGPYLAAQSRHCLWSKFLVTSSLSCGTVKPPGGLGVSCTDTCMG